MNSLTQELQRSELISIPKPPPPKARRASVARSGIALGLVMATSTWIWVAAVDQLAGHPLRTFEALGGTAAFTVVHYVLNLAYGVALVGIIRGAARAPSLIIGAIFGFIIFEVAFGMMTVLLSNVSLGPLAWVSILGGNLFGATIAFLLLARGYPLATWLRQAEDER